MAKPKQSDPKPYLHIPIQRSSSVSASPINSNLKSLREWANFRWAAERPRKKDVMMTWVLVLSRGLEDIYSSSGWHSCRALLLSTCEEAQANSSARGPSARNPALSALRLPSALHSGTEQVPGKCLFLPQTLLPQRSDYSDSFPTALSLLCSLRSELQNFRLWVGTHTPDGISQGSVRSFWLIKLSVRQPSALNWLSNFRERTKRLKRVFTENSSRKVPEEKIHFAKDQYRSLSFFHWRLIESSGKLCF